MSRLILATGGARSGKSTFAEKYLEERFQAVSYIATAIAFDDEMKDRISKHQAQRPDHWKTFEAYKDLNQLMSQVADHSKACLLDCLTIMVTNRMMDAYPEIDWDHPKPEAVNRLQSEILNDVSLFLDAAREADLTLVMVTNELGMGVVPEYPMARAFRDIAGRVNQLVASKADEVYLLVCGLPMVLKGGNL